LHHLKKQAKSGKTLSEAIDGRETTLTEIAKVMLKHQIEFFERGPKFIKSLRLADVAQQINLHTATIGHAVRSKYVDTPTSVVEMAKFLDTGIGTPFHKVQF
jgi:RNA polymerase sigma-54 factor